MKKWYLSKTLWINALAISSVFLSSNFGIDLTTEETTGILAVINMILRIVTKEPIK